MRAVGLVDARPGFVMTLLALAVAAGTATQDVFLGFSHELVRNAQVFYGWHLGKTDVPGPEDDRSSSVTTVKRFRSNFFPGITSTSAASRT